MKNKILIYDDNCPLCAWYSSLFVACGLLPPEGRKPFSSVEPSLLLSIDLDKSRNEIPLLDTKSGKVLYGIDALLDILGQRTGFITTAGKIKPINWFLKKIYRLVSFNRKVIVAKKCGAGNIDCSPDLNYRYRTAFMLLSLALNSLMLFPLYAIVFVPASGSDLSITQVQLAHFAMVFANCVLAFNFSKAKAIEYLGQINMLALLTILLLIPLILTQYWFAFPEGFSLLYLVATAIVIFREYLRRMEYAGVLTGNKWIAAMNLAGMVAFTLFLLR